MLEDRLYFFQFPSPFPKFSYKESSAMDVDVEPLSVAPEPSTSSKRVSFAADVKPDITPSRTPSTVPSEPKQEQPLDGIIGQLEVYRSGAVKIRLANGILLDVSVPVSEAVGFSNMPFSHFCRSARRRNRHSYNRP